jgi:hypothetical protein
MLPNIIKKFDSWGDFVDYVVPMPKDVPGCIMQSRTNSSSNFSFTNVKTYEEAIELARTGWKEGADKVKTISDPIFLHVSSLVERHSITHDVEGIQVDIARYLDGEPECWIQWERQIVESPGTKIVRMIFNGSVSGGVSTETIERVGAAAVALVELLEYSGTRVEIFLENVFARYVGPEYPKVISQVKIKSADQPLDIPRLAFALGHPACLRRLGFAFVELQSKEYRESIGSSYGMPIPLTMKGDIVIPELSYLNEETRTPEKAEAWIIKQLEAQGVELKKVQK